jgi:hypothetical protein
MTEYVKFFLTIFKTKVTVACPAPWPLEIQPPLVAWKRNSAAAVTEIKKGCGHAHKTRMQWEHAHSSVVSRD